MVSHAEQFHSEYGAAGCCGYELRILERSPPPSGRKLSKGPASLLPVRFVGLRIAETPKQQSIVNLRLSNTRPTSCRRSKLSFFLGFRKLHDPFVAVDGRRRWKLFVDSWAQERVPEVPLSCSREASTLARTPQYDGPRLSFKDG